MQPLVGVGTECTLKSSPARSVCYPAFRDNRSEYNGTGTWWHNAVSTRSDNSLPGLKAYEIAVDNEGQSDGVLLLGERLELALVACLGENQYLECLDPLLRSFGVDTATPQRTIRLKNELIRRFEETTPGTHFPIVGESVGLYRFYKSLAAAALDSDSHVLITGETGTGKEVAAEV
ncbi:MAG: sigma 54-interacting transcriptional regulator, partial [Verrucomicrobia bacterium]|nr:sigma 54-interacting transcriptional regulator [Verrucomicrobiota bacterium]